MNARNLLPVLLVLTLPTSVMGQEPPNSPIHSDGSCDIEGVVFRGTISNRLMIVPGDPDLSLNDISDGLTVECRSGQLEYHIIGRDRDDTNRITKVLFSGDVEGSMYSEISGTGLVHRMYEDGPWSRVFLFESYTPYRLVGLTDYFVEYREFEVVSISPEYQRLFSNE